MLVRIDIYMNPTCCEQQYINYKKNSNDSLVMIPHANANVTFPYS